MKLKREHLTTRKEKSKSYILNFRIAGIILSIILIIAAVAIINVKLYQSVATHQQTQRVISQIDEQVHLLDGQKWEIISEQNISPTELKQVHKQRDVIRSLLNKLEIESGHNEQFTEINYVFEDYNVSTSLLFNLIAEGNLKKISSFGLETVEPTFKKLNELITNTEILHNETLIVKQRNSFNTGAATTAVAFVMLIVLGRYLERNRKTLLINDLFYSQIKYLFDASNEAICVIDRNFNVTRTNKTFIDMFGSNKDKKCYELCMNKLCHTDKCHLNRIFKGDDSIEDLIDRKLADGSVGYYLVTACPYYDSEDKLIGIIKNFRDVTERTRSVELLRRYKLLTKYARDIILFADDKGFILDANNAALKFYGYSKELLLTMNIRDLHPPETRMPKFKRTALDEGLTFETVHIDIKGIKLPVEVSTIRVSFENEGIIVSIARDITGRKRAELLLKEQKEFADNLILNLSVPSFVLDPQHKVLVWNKACEELTGVKEEEVVATDNHWQAFYKTKKHCLADAIIDNSLELLPESYVVMNQSKIISQGLYSESWLEINNNHKYVIAEAAPIFDSNNNMVAAIETLQDITERKKAETELLKFNKKMRLEFELASKVQKSMLPKELPAIPNIGISWKFEPSIYVGGDMLDIFYQDEDKIGFYILDVNGHGISAALNAVALSYHLNSNYRIKDISRDNTTFSPSVILTEINKYYSSKINGFVTIIYGNIDTNTLLMTYARAGHCLPIIVSQDGCATVLEQGGVAVGLLKDAAYSDITVQLKPGDKVLLYTDGALESENSISAKPFLMNDFVNQLSTYRHECIADIVDTVISQAKNRTETLEVRDDITVLGFEIN